MIEGIRKSDWFVIVLKKQRTGLCDERNKTHKVQLIRKENRKGHLNSKVTKIIDDITVTKHLASNEFNY